MIQFSGDFGKRQFHDTSIFRISKCQFSKNIEIFQENPQTARNAIFSRVRPENITFLGQIEKRLINRDARTMKLPKLTQQVQKMIDVSLILSSSFFLEKQSVKQEIMDPEKRRKKPEPTMDVKEGFDSRNFNRHRKKKKKRCGVSLRGNNANPDFLSF